MATLLELTAKIARTQTPKVQAFKNKNTDFVVLDGATSAYGDLMNVGILSEAYDAFRDVGHVKHPQENVGGEFVHIVIGKRRAFLPATPGKQNETRRHTVVYDVFEFDDENVFVASLAEGLALGDAEKVADNLYHAMNHHAVRHSRDADELLRRRVNGVPAWKKLSNRGF